MPKYKNVDRNKFWFNAHEGGFYQKGPSCWIKIPPSDLQAMLSLESVGTVVMDKLEDLGPNRINLGYPTMKMSMENYTTIEVRRKSPNSPIVYLNLNRPSARNALPQPFWTEFPLALSSLDQNPDVAVIILSGIGAHFCAGIDLKSLQSLAQDVSSSDRGRTGERLRREIKSLQDSITAVEKCRKPVIAAVQGACIGAGVDLITACDIRYCTEDAFFSVKEVDLAMAADVGTLQRLPAIVGYGNAMELALTARRFSSLEAKELGLVSRVFASKAAMDEGVGAIAEGIAAKSPLGVIGTKAVLLRSRDMTVSQGLDYVATWNSAVLLSHDLTEVMSAQNQKRKPIFAKL